MHNKSKKNLGFEKILLYVHKYISFCVYDCHERFGGGCTKGQPRCGGLVVATHVSAHPAATIGTTALSCVLVAILSTCQKCFLVGIEVKNYNFDFSCYIYKQLNKCSRV